MYINDLTESSGYSLRGSFTKDLIISKLWLLSKLADISKDFSTIYVLGSWYGNLAILCNFVGSINYKKLINVELNKGMLSGSKKLLDSLGAKNIEYMLKDANTLDYRQLGKNGVVVNTSLTDMEGTDWFKNIPPGTVVAMQARDMDPGVEFNSTADIIKKFPVEVLYKGTKKLEDPETKYRRFMVIGIKQ